VQIAVHELKRGAFESADIWARPIEDLGETQLLLVVEDLVHQRAQPDKHSVHVARRQPQSWPIIEAAIFTHWRVVTILPILAVAITIFHIHFLGCFEWTAHQGSLVGSPHVRQFGI
jgi:hypothetical protein